MHAGGSQSCACRWLSVLCMLQRLMQHAISSCDLNINEGPCNIEGGGGGGGGGGGMGFGLAIGSMQCMVSVRLQGQD